MPDALNTTRTPTRIAERPAWARRLLGYPSIDEWARELRLREEPELPRLYPPSM